MAIRQIRTIGDEILTKECKPVKEMNERTLELIEDMFETMYENNGVGLAAPQVGVRKRVVVIDVEDGNQYVLINPEILETSGSQTGQEGCLSVPGKCGQVTRADHVKAKALNRACLLCVLQTHNICNNRKCRADLFIYNILNFLDLILAHCREVSEVETKSVSCHKGTSLLNMCAEYGS